ncbi:MAG: hypothetical protein ACW97A_00405 [Candidatus Thorarchaeota archaeon]|jgi:hypothetical protein
MDDTKYFIESYSSEGETSENRINSYYDILENLRMILKRMAKVKKDIVEDIVRSSDRQGENERVLNSVP